jgi:Helix-turn-helix.
MRVNTTKIKYLLLDKGWSIGKLGTAAGISNATIYALINNQRGFHASTIMSIATALGVKATDIIED